MCAQCGNLSNLILQQGNQIQTALYHISQLYTQLAQGSNAEYEYSEPLGVGGPGQPTTYMLKSPFDKTAGQQYKIENASAGAGTGIFLVSGVRGGVIPGFVSTDTGTVEQTPINGFLGTCPANGTDPVTSGWYDLTDSSGIVYVTVSSSQAVYVTIQFRRKR